MQADIRYGNLTLAFIRGFLVFFFLSIRKSKNPIEPNFDMETTMSPQGYITTKNSMPPWINTRRVALR